MVICVEKLNIQPLLQRLKNIFVHIIQARLSSLKSLLHHKGIGMAAIPKIHVLHMKGNFFVDLIFKSAKMRNDFSCLPNYF